MPANLEPHEQRAAKLALAAKDYFRGVELYRQSHAILRTYGVCIEARPEDLDPQTKAFLLSIAKGDRKALHDAEDYLKRPIEVNIPKEEPKPALQMSQVEHLNQTIRKAQKILTLQELCRLLGDSPQDEAWIKRGLSSLEASGHITRPNDLGIRHTGKEEPASWAQKRVRDFIPKLAQLAESQEVFTAFDLGLTSRMLGTLKRRKVIKQAGHGFRVNAQQLNVQKHLL